MRISLTPVVTSYYNLTPLQLRNCAVWMLPDVFHLYGHILGTKQKGLNVKSSPCLIRIINLIKADQILSHMFRNLVQRHNL